MPFGASILSGMLNRQEYKCEYKEETVSAVSFYFEIVAFTMSLLEIKFGW
jgi:hypothetical protein